MLVIGIFSLIYGIFFALYPQYFISLTHTENINIAWLRNIGASILGILFAGMMIIYYDSKGTLKLILVITITSILQTIFLIYSRFSNEFSAKKMIIIDITIFIAVVFSLYLVFLLIKYRDFFK